mgnify:CR=1 FL=1
MASKKRRGNGEGSINQTKSGGWRAQIAQNGNRFGKTFSTRKEAQIWLASLQTDTNFRPRRNSAKMIFAEFLQHWLLSSKSRISDETYYSYSQLSSKYITPNLGKLKLRDLTSADIQQFYNEQVCADTGLRTIEKCHNVLHASLNNAVNLGLISRNPATNTDPPRPRKKEATFLSQSQVRHFLTKALETDKLVFPLYSLALITGMRQGELLGLQWSDLDFHRGKLHIKRTLVRKPGGGLALKDPKTQSSKRTVALQAATMTILEKHSDNQKVQSEILCKKWKNTGHIFTSSIGTPIDPSNLHKRFKRLLKAAGLPNIRFHDLRHTAASLMLNNGIDVYVASRSLGHASPSITLDVYGHLLPNSSAAVAEVMEKIVLTDNYPAIAPQNNLSIVRK